MNMDPMVVAPSDGVTRGDDRNYPNRGTSSGMVNKGEPYGADIGMDATNGMGSFHAGSDPAALDVPQGGGTLGGTNSPPNDGDGKLGSATASDSPGDTVPDDQRG